MWKDQHGSLFEVFPAEAKADSCLSHTVLEPSLRGKAGRGGVGGSVICQVPRAGRWTVQ